MGKARGGLDEASRAASRGVEELGASTQKGKVCVREHSNARRVRKEGKSVTEHTATREREGSV